MKTYEEPNCCAFCGKPTRFPYEMFCSHLCELDFNEPIPIKTKAQVIRMGTDIDGGVFVAE